jgi:hypothetical protein
MVLQLGSEHAAIVDIAASHAAHALARRAIQTR